jgi:hypothetical protein
LHHRATTRDTSATEAGSLVGELPEVDGDGLDRIAHAGETFGRQRAFPGRRPGLWTAV